MSARRRFVAPARGEVDAGCFESPLYAGFARHANWLRSATWPGIDALNAALGEAIHPHSDTCLQFVEQTLALLADGLHYEQRIYERGLIATRSHNWHDLFNAMIWIEHTAIKAELNARQYADVREIGVAQRTRAQYAMTQFDEAGAIVLLHDTALLTLWDAHDWQALFWRERAAWSDGRIEVIVFGHALLEHALHPSPLHSAKCIALTLDCHSDDPSLWSTVEQTIARAIRNGELLNDPQHLRPLPLSGIPQWHPETDNEDFYRSADCFRPLRPGRRYPVALQLCD